MTEERTKLAEEHLLQITDLRKACVAAAGAGGVSNSDLAALTLAVVKASVAEERLIRAIETGKPVQLDDPSDWSGIA